MSPDGAMVIDDCELEKPLTWCSAGLRTIRSSYRLPKKIELWKLGVIDEYS